MAGGVAGQTVATRDSAAAQRNAVNTGGARAPGNTAVGNTSNAPSTGQTAASNTPGNRAASNTGNAQGAGNTAARSTGNATGTSNTATSSTGNAARNTGNTAASGAAAGNTGNAARTTGNTAAGNTGTSTTASGATASTTPGSAAVQAPGAGRVMIGTEAVQASDDEDWFKGAARAAQAALPENTSNRSLEDVVIASSAVSGRVTRVGRDTITVRDREGSDYVLTLDERSQGVRQGRRVSLRQLQEGTPVRARFVLMGGRSVARDVRIRR
ncbi:hypothetical protein [Myxococcus qinghaiensis]|uniref:hypothetical protein n=1 Tax=Myxococcus qinghaiensis TaxID=2906758 RepID=UPI0020A80DF0|nr:hypothetical protein [Myxococcus qinghaiensis]MCP3169784.1 hypothetical protein [Myxococcus qinghaiensis]